VAESVARMAAPTALSMRYQAAPAALGADVLAALAFDRTVPTDDARWIRVGYGPVGEVAPVEVWRSHGPVTRGRTGAIRHAQDDVLQFGCIELDEREHGGPEGVAAAAYAAIAQFVQDGTHPHVLRMWNAFSAINLGEGDEERYKRFCNGRAQGLAPVLARYFPAATAIGRRDDDPVLQVTWLSARDAGIPLENPRQVSAYRYPRQYGPTSPSFARAMLVGGDTLLISGTSSVVGHETHHAGDVHAQLLETLTNLDTVLQRAHALAPGVPRRFGAGSALRVYLRDPASQDTVRALLATHLPPEVSYVVLEGDICRADLTIEIDGVHRAV